MFKRHIVVVVTLATLAATWQGASSAGGPPPTDRAQTAQTARAASPIFDAPEHLAHTASGGAPPAIVVDRNGVVTAVWRQDYSGAGGTTVYALRAARRGLGGRWSTPTTIACPRPGTCAGQFPRLAVDAKGTVTAAWASDMGVMAVRRPAGGPWGTPRRLTSDTTPMRPSLLHLAVAASGAVFVTWHPVRQDVWVVRRPAGGSWTKPLVFEAGEGRYGQDPGLAAWGDGRALLAYTRYTDRPWSSSGAVVVVRVFRPGSGWGPARPIGHGGSPTFALGPHHSAICAWTYTGGVKARDLRRGTWSSPVRLGHEGYLALYGVAAGMDRAGNEFVGWIRNDDVVPNTGFLASKPAGAAWSRRVIYGAARWAFDGPPIVAQTNATNDAVAMFPSRTLFRPHGQAWTAPLRFGGHAGALLPSGALLRMWWRADGLVAQRVHLR